jgi:hypothetical protein
MPCSRWSIAAKGTTRLKALPASPHLFVRGGEFQDIGIDFADPCRQPGPLMLTAAHWTANWNSDIQKGFENNRVRIEPGRDRSARCRASGENDGHVP